MADDVTSKLVNFVAETGFDDLPVGVVAQTKRFILDVVACCFGGYLTDIGLICLKVVTSLGGKPESTIIGGSHRTSCLNAAYVNTNTANALDFDDAHLNFLHVGPSVVPAALAAGERAGATGKDVITAVALGYDIAARLGLSMGMPFIVRDDGTFESAPVQGTSWKTFGSVVASARCLGLDKGQLEEAMNIGGANAPVPAMKKWEWDPVRPLPLQKNNVGWMSYAGVMASLCAREGLTGLHGILEGDHGFWRMVGARQCEFDLMVNNLGGEWHILEAGIKPYPSCRHMHSALDLFRSILHEQDIAPEEIERVVVGVSPMSTRPVWMNTRPKNMVEGEFSIPHCMAMIAFGVDPGPDWHTPQRLQDKTVAEFVRKVEIVPEPKATAAMIEQYPSLYRRLPANVEVTTSRGVFSKATEYARGESWLPEFALTDGDLRHKLRCNALPLWRTSAVWERQVEAVADAVLNLDALGDVRELASLLVPVQG